MDHRTPSGPLARPATGKLGNRQTGPLPGGDSLQVSSGVSPAPTSTWERQAIERAGELSVLLALGRRLIEDYARPLEALRLVLGLVKPGADTEALLANYGEHERQYLLKLAEHVTPKADLRRRMETASLQMEGARQGVADFAARLQDALVAVPDEGMAAMRDLRTESLRGVLHPVTVLHAAFEGDSYFRELFPPPRVKLTGGTGLLRPVDPPVAPAPPEPPRSPTGGLGQALGEGLGRLVRSATQSLKPPGSGPLA